MKTWTQVAYLYDGSFSGFLTCVFEAFTHREAPACFFTPEDARLSLWPEREVTTDESCAKRVYQSLASKISRDAQRFVSRGFLTCLEERELHLWHFICYGYEAGASVMGALTDDRVAPLWKALGHLGRELEHLKGFVRFSQQGDILAGEIAPKNRLLPLLRPHFCSRYPDESFVLYDQTYHEALFYRPAQWTIVPLEDFKLGRPDQQELDYRRLWRQFYDTIAIEGRYNPKLRRTHMPKYFWANMTEFQTDA